MFFVIQCTTSSGIRRNPFVVVFCEKLQYSGFCLVSTGCLVIPSPRTNYLIKNVLFRESAAWNKLLPAYETNSLKTLLKQTLNIFTVVNF